MEVDVTDSYRKQIARQHSCQKIGQYSGRAIFLPIEFDHYAKSGYYFSYRLRACKGSQEICGTPVYRVPFGYGVWLNPKTRMSSTCLTISNRMASVGCPKKFSGRWSPAPLGRRRVIWPPRNTPLPTGVRPPTVANLVALGQSAMASVGGPKNFRSARPPIF